MAVNNGPSLVLLSTLSLADLGKITSSSILTLLHVIKVVLFFRLPHADDTGCLCLYMHVFIIAESVEALCDQYSNELTAKSLILSR
jgi:hypothetical protein